jgi:hypothetical protein
MTEALRYCKAFQNQSPARAIMASKMSMSGKASGLGTTGPQLTPAVSNNLPEIGLVPPPRPSDATWQAQHWGCSRLS